MPADVVAVRIDDFSRDDAGGRMGEQVSEPIVGRDQSKPHRVAIERFDARNRRIVVELAVFRRAGQVVETDNLVAHHELIRRALRRVHEALERIDDILRGQLAGARP